MKNLLTLTGIVLLLISCNSAEFEKLKAENAELLQLADESAQEAERQAELAAMTMIEAEKQRELANEAIAELAKCKNGK